MSWQESPLGMIADTQLGKMLDAKKNEGEYHPYLGNDNVQWDGLDLSEVKEMRFKDSELSKFALRAGDLLVCEGGDPGRCAIWNSDEEMCYQKALHRVRAHEGVLDNRYLYYYLVYIGSTQEIRQYYTGGATIKHLPAAALNRVKVRYPDLSTQCRIADVLSAYDELIENSRRQIKLLEEAAQRLYKEWFIDLKFPGHEVTPIVDGLPEGWRRTKLVDVADVQYGFAFKASQFNSDGNGLPIIRIRNVVDGFSRDYTTEKADEKYLVYDGDTVVGMDGDFYINTWTGGMAYLVQRSCRIKAHDDGLDAYLRWAIVAPIRAFQNGIVGATVAHLGKRHIDSIEVLIPPYGAAGLFSDLRDQIVNLKKQIAAAREARDRLLPKLMSGEIEVQ